MSGTAFNSQPGNNARECTPPQHRVHDSNEPLPGSRTAKQQYEGQNACNSERPLDVQPTSEGGVARGGRADVSTGEANLLDKFVGKAEKVIGKVTGNAEIREAGELREAGGKKAVAGDARAAHG